MPFLTHADAPPQPTTAPTLLLEDDAGQPHPQGSYHFTLFTSVHEPEANVRLWVARAATPDFSKAQWQATPLKEVQVNNMKWSEADVPLGTPTLPYLAARGEVEVAGKEGAPVQHFSSTVTVLPQVKVWSRRKDDGSRSVYCQPSEAVPSMRLWVAQSATRDFEHAHWQFLTVTPPAKGNTWDDYSSTVPAASKATPYVAIYAEVGFPSAAQPARVLSPTIIWNSSPMPANAAALTAPICPLHGTSEGVVPVVYGVPGAGTPADAVIGGCIVGPGSPTWHCKLCDCSWGDIMAEMAKPK